MKDAVAVNVSFGSEQDVRFQIIDRILVDVLGWERGDVKTEPHTEKGYIDYLIAAGDRPLFVIEAKRVEKKLFSTVVPDQAYYKVWGPALQDARDGIEQAAAYCFDMSVPFACLTNGVSWLGFRASRTDGIRYKDGIAVAFPSLESVSDNFALFFDLFSKAGVIAKLYNVVLDRAEGRSAAPQGRLMPAIVDQDIHMLPKSDLARDLDQVFSEFFRNISGDVDPDLLMHCFVETPESREADRSLEKITRELVNTVKSITSTSGGELEEELKLSVETKRGQVVLIIGNKGAGKSTFIDRFFRFVLHRQVREQCLIVKVDLAELPGTQRDLSEWLTEKLLDAIETELYGGESPSYDELVGIFFDHYQRWAKGEYKYLHDQDLEAFKIKFGEYIFDRRDKRRHEYLLALLRRSLRGRQRMPCIVFDNADNHPLHVQEAVFQYGYSIFRNMLAFVVVPVTDRTIWTLSKAGPFQSYFTRTFYLPVPSTKQVLEKRIAFIKRKIVEEKGHTGQYFLSKGIKLSVKNIEAFATCVEEAFVKTNFISRTIGWLTNYDLRRSLELSQRVITAPVLRVDDLLAAYFSDGKVEIPPFRVTQAFLFGNYNRFKQSANDFVLNVFAPEKGVAASPLLRLTILRVMADREAAAGDALEAYLRFEELEYYLEPMGFSTQAALAAVQELVVYRLLEPYDPTASQVAPTTRIAITFNGKIHLEMAMIDPVYVEHMAVTTYLASEDVVRQLRRIQSAKMAMSDWAEVRSVFVQHILLADEQLARIPSLPDYSGQDALRHELARKWVIKRGTLARFVRNRR